jgi:WD40 repeat protein
MPLLLFPILAAVAQELPARAFDGHRPSEFVRFVPGGKFLLTGGPPDRPVKLWRLDTGALVSTMGRDVAGVACSADGRRAVFAGAAGAQLWDLDAGSPLASFDTGPAAAAAFDGRTVTVLARRLNGRRLEALAVSTWDADGPRKSAFEIPVTRTPSAMSLSPDGARLALGLDDGSVRIWDVAAAREVGKLPGHPDRAAALAFSADGRRLASAGHDGAVVIWDAVEGREASRHPAPEGGARSPRLAFSPDGAVLAVAGDAGVELREPASGKRLGPLYAVPAMGVWFAADVDVAPGGRSLAAAGLLFAKEAPQDRRTTGPVFLWRVKS